MPWTKTKTGYKKTRGGKGHIKRPKVYEALRKKGMSKKRAARIANAKSKAHKKQ